MAQRIFLVGFMIILVASLGAAARSGTQEQVEFVLVEKVELSLSITPSYWWCACPCPVDIEVTEWHVTDTCGRWIYFKEYETPVDGFSWKGVWPQVNADGVRVPPGVYRISVATSLGTLVRAVKIVDPCLRACPMYPRCTFEEIPAFSGKRVRVELVVEGVNN